MKSVGEILQAGREKKGISLEEVAMATRIKKEFLEAIEENDFHKISSEVVTKGFIKNYAEFLGLSSEPILPIFKRDFVKEKKPMGVFLKPGFVWTPRLTLVIIIVIFSFLIGFYLGRQYLSLANTPY